MLIQREKYFTKLKIIMGRSRKDIVKVYKYDYMMH